MTEVRCKSAVDVLEPRLGALNHPDGLVRLTMFSHDSPGLRKIRRQIAEALVMLLEQDHTISRKRKRANTTD